MEINNFVKEKYSFETILKYQSRDKNNYGSSTWLNFERVTDLADPTNDWLPFVF